jgi:hypothetical protein
MTNDKALTQKPKAEAPAVQKSSVAQLLEYPFRPDQVKRRPDGFDYIETSAVIQRLNDSLGYEGWSFEVVEQAEMSDEAIVKGRLVVYYEGKTIIREQFGSHPYQKRRGTGEIISKGDVLKSAASDALKKCASLLGIGLHVYADDGSYRSFGANGEVVDSPVEGKPHKDNPNKNELLANNLMAEIYKVGQERGLDRAAVDEIAWEKTGRAMVEWGVNTLLSFRKALSEGAFDKVKVS